MRARLAVALGVVAALNFVTLPDVPLCAFRWITHRPCPLCGLTHAFVALAHGNFGEAIHLHALSPVAAVALGALVWNPLALTRYWRCLAIAFAIYGVARMF